MTDNKLKDIPTFLSYDDVLLLPNFSEILPADVQLETSLTSKITLKIPVVASPMDTVCEGEMAEGMAKMGGYGIIHRNLKIIDQAQLLKAVLKKGLKAGVAVGVGQDFEERVKALVKVGATEICIDSAHGHTKNVINAVKFIKMHYPDVEVIAGNVATYEGAVALFEAGAEAVKVGMGPGSICTTRLVTGMGVPQLSAVALAVKAARKYKKKVIADGGIRYSGDIVKALAIGADAVMLGSLLAGTDESPGQVIEIDGKKFKSYRGMGSRSAMRQGSAERYGHKAGEKNNHKLVPEGIEALVEYRGSIECHINQLLGGVKAGMAYLGSKNLKELIQKANFVRMTSAGLGESKPHSVIELKA